MKKHFMYLFLLCLIGFCISCSSNKNITFVQKADQIDILADNQLITSYVYKQENQKPIMFPVYSPSGEIVTRGFPIMPVEGESTDHPHHRGITFTYGNGEVNGSTFWGLPNFGSVDYDNIRLPQIKHEKVLEMKEGDKDSKLSTESLWIDKTNKPILRENRIMEFYADKDENRIDFTITLTALDTVVTFEDTKEGMLSIRVADWLAETPTGAQFKGKGTGEYLNAEGGKKEKEIWGKRSAWVRLEGNKNEKSIGVVIFHHPKSLNFPTYWHARGYGCFALNPIGQFDYQKGTGVENPQRRSLQLKPGESALFKFRMIIYEGNRDKDNLDKEFQNYSNN